MNTSALTQSEIAELLLRSPSFTPKEGDRAEVVQALTVLSQTTRADATIRSITGGVADKYGATTTKPMWIVNGESTAGGDVHNVILSDRTTTTKGHKMLADGSGGGTRFNSPQVDTNSRPATTVAALTESVQSTYGQTELVAALDALPGEVVWLGNSLFRGAFKMSEMARDTAPGIRLYENILAANALGWSVAVVHFSTCTNDNGTTTSAAFQQTMRQHIQDICSWQPGFRPVFLISPHSAHGVGSPTMGGSIGAWELIESGLVEAVCGTYGFGFDTAGTDVHWTEKWQVVHGLYAARCVERLASGKGNPALIVKTATRAGTKVTLTFNRDRLVLDDVNFHAVTQKGFKALDGGVDLAITSAQVEGKTVILELASAPAGQLYIQYGIDYNVAPYNNSATTATRGGNLYASNGTEEFHISLGIKMPVLDWAIPFRKLVS